MKSEENGSTQSNAKSYDLKDVLEDPIFPYWMNICRIIDSEYKLYVAGSHLYIIIPVLRDFRV